MDITIIYASLILLTSIPCAYLLYKITKDEKELIHYYFPAILWTLAVASAIFYTTNIKNGFITTHVFLTLFIWLQFSKKQK